MSNIVEVDRYGTTVPSRYKHMIDIVTFPGL
jgi:hypothetical protein